MLAEVGSFSSDSLRISGNSATAAQLLLAVACAVRVRTDTADGVRTVSLRHRGDRPRCGAVQGEHPLRLLGYFSLYRTNAQNSSERTSGLRTASSGWARSGTPIKEVFSRQEDRRKTGARVPHSVARVPQKARAPRASGVSRRRPARHLVLTGHGARCTWRRTLATAPRTLDGGQSPRHLAVLGWTRLDPLTQRGQGDGACSAVSRSHGAAIGPNVARVG